jgi:DNA-directed RNA polymerase II subunit RPB2
MESEYNIKSDKDVNNNINNNTEDINYLKDYNNIVKAFFDEYGIIHMQLQSFEKFIEKGIPQVLEDNNPQTIVLHMDELSDEKYKIELFFHNSTLNKPILSQNDDTDIDLIPIMARLKNCTYWSNFNLDIDIIIYKYDVENKIYTIVDESQLLNINIGKIPIMVGSKYCILKKYDNYTNNDFNECEQDRGGYFIINGSEKVVIAQERIAENKAYSFKNNKPTKYVESVEIKSIIPGKYVSPKMSSVKILSRDDINFPNCIYVSIPNLKTEIPIFILYKALGIETDKEIYSTILYDLKNDYNKELKQILFESINKFSHIKNQDDALMFISKKVTNIPADVKEQQCTINLYMIKLITSEFIPHVGPNFKQKALFLGYMTRKLLLTYLKRIPYDDRDNYINKRIDTSGVLLTNLFKLHYIKMLGETVREIKKEFNRGSWKATNDITKLICQYNIYKIFKGTIIENGIKTAIATGNFGSAKSQFLKSGIAQLLNRLSFYSVLSHLRRINTPIEKSGKLIAPRKLNGSSFGYICPTETPEGASIGILKNLSTLGLITSYYSSDHILQLLRNLNVILFDDIYDINYKELYYNTKVFINGNWIGYVFNSVYLYNQLKDYKKNGIINIYTAIVLDHTTNELYINTDAGRCIRPLYILENNKLLINKSDINKLQNNIYNWKNLVCGNINNTVNEINQNFVEDINLIENKTKLEFIDIMEASYSLIATKEQLDNNITNLEYSYCEIHPCLILGIIANLIPFSNYNQAPRNTYQSAMGKQAIGIYSSKYMNRLDTVGHIMSYPQNPIINTFINKHIDNFQLPHGVNVTVAIMCGRENQEDSILINRSSVERGLLHTEHFKTYIQKEERQSFNDEEKFCIPNPNNTIGIKSANYDKLSEDGFIKKGLFVEANDVIIGKCIPIKKETSKYVNKDASVVLKNNESGIVTNVYEGQNSDGYNFVKIQIRDQRIPMVGDKLSSRHGQKGIIGQLIPNEDMPTTKDGITPDIIINVHCIPSRMTVAHIHETNFAVLCSLLGFFGDATPFSGYSGDDIYELLENAGLNRASNQILYNGITGDQMDAEIFMGTTYYQRLKHMVCEKEHSRATGPIVNLNRQPSEGRTRDGGFRFGEMERDCNFATSLISFSSGLSSQIQYLKDNTELILGWNKELKGITGEKQISYKKIKEQRECIELIFEDGRTLKVTPNHELLTEDGVWIEAQNITNERIKCSIKYPEMNIKQERIECNNWEYEIGYIKLKTDSDEEFLKTLAFARILGYLITDGHLGKDYSGYLFMGHQLDVEQILNDLKLFNGTEQDTFKLNKQNIYTIKLSKEFEENIRYANGILFGGKIDQNACLPEFITNDCPRPIIREFLGGLFGGDGHACCLGNKGKNKNRTITSVKYSQTKKTSYLKSLVNMILQLKQLLHKCNIDNISIENLKETTSSKKNKTKNNDEDEDEDENENENEDENNKNKVENINDTEIRLINSVNEIIQDNNNDDNKYELNLKIKLSDLQLFSENIGYRYCCHKTQRLCAAVSYRNMRTKTLQQRNLIINNSIPKFIKNKNDRKNQKPRKNNKNFVDNLTYDDCAKLAYNELKEIEVIIHDYVEPSGQNIKDAIKKLKNTTQDIYNTNTIRFENSKKQLQFPTPGIYFETIGCINWFRNGDGNKSISYGVKREAQCLPTMNLKVIHKNNIGLQDVYDIEVENNHSYIANGVVSHNCMISHGTSNMLKERMLDVSDHFKTFTCNNCGNFANVNEEENIYGCVYCNNKLDFSEIHIPYPCKLLFQELQAMAINPRIITK